MAYFGNKSIDFGKQIKKVYSVDSVTEDHTRFNVSETKNLKGISLDTIRSSLQHSILRREVFSKIAQQGFNTIKIEKSDFDQIISLSEVSEFMSLFPVTNRSRLLGERATADTVEVGTAIL